MGAPHRGGGRLAQGGWAHKQTAPEGRAGQPAPISPTARYPAHVPLGPLTFAGPDSGTGPATIRIVLKLT
jgi:hypothetical protein